MTASLDDLERRRWLASPLWGDRWVEDHARIAAVPAPRRGSPAVDASGPVPSLSLDGEWRLAGATPGREFSIDVWTGAGEGRQLPVDWHRSDTDRSAWVPARVPGTVQSALVEAGLLPDPLQDSHTYDELTEFGVPEEWPWHFRRTRVEQQEWWYARTIDVPADWRGRRVRLSFDGVDYAASFFVNGEPVARHSGMYGGPDIDVSALLRCDGTDEVVVRIDPAPRDWHGVMKPSPGWGWHYGHLISAGIWRSVRLELVPDVELADVFVSTTAVRDGDAHLRVRWDLVRHDFGSGRVPVTVVVERPDGSTAAVADLTARALPGTTRHEADVVVGDAELWWPFGYGAQPLHRVAVRIGTTTVTVPVGIRTVDYRPLPERGGPDLYDWELVVNGTPLFIKGANWCWTDPMARRGFEIDRHLLDLVQRANLQMLRAWGGGTVESDAFYEECDRRGILVLQEFPLSFGLDASAADLAAIDEQASRIVRRLRNHPSLVLWGGGNENPATITSDDPLTVIGKRVAQYDPSRRFHRTDPWGGSEHYYGVYHEGLPVEAYNELLPVVFGEYGLSSQCDLESMSRFVDPALLDQWPPEPHGAIVQHQSQFSLFDLVKQARYAHYGPIADWRTFIEYSQLAQGDALRFASERMRAHSGQRTAGYWFYKVGEVFPGASWAVIDYYGRPKLSYYRAAQFGAPVAAFAVSPRTAWGAGDAFEASVHVSNDTPEALDAACVTARLYDARFTVLAERSSVVSVPAGGRVDPFGLTATVPAEHARPLILSVRLEDAEGRRVSSAWYTYSAQAQAPRARQWEEIPLAELEQHPASEVLAAYVDGDAPLADQPRTTLRAHRSGDALVVENVGAVPAPLVLIDGFPHAPGRWLADNAFGLEPGERREVRFCDGGASMEAVSVRAWNADAVPVAP